MVSDDMSDNQNDDAVFLSLFKISLIRLRDFLLPFQQKLTLTYRRIHTYVQEHIALLDNTYICVSRLPSM